MSEPLTVGWPIRAAVWGRRHRRLLFRRLPDSKPFSFASRQSNLLLLRNPACSGWATHGQD